MVIEGTNGRRYNVAADGKATLIEEAQERCYYCEDAHDSGFTCEGCHADFAAQAEAERYAEFGMSYVHGGGQASDVAAAWRQFGSEMR